MSQNITPVVGVAGRPGLHLVGPSAGSGEGRSQDRRITCSKFANIIKDPTGGKNPDYLVADDEKISKIIGLPPIPLARRYILPEVGHLFGHVDWSQQEIRITAHFEEGRLAKAYRDNPKEDIHQFCTKLINEASGQSYAAMSSST
jgi:hypothetical protein